MRVAALPHLSRPAISPLLVGRAHESESLGQMLAAARQRQGSIVLLAGEAGIGKSRLVGETRRQAATLGFEVLVGHCSENDIGLAYAPLIDTLRAWFAPYPESTIATLLGVWAPEIVKLLPELAHTIPHLQPTAPLDGEAERRRLFENLYRVLLQSTLPPRSTPLLLIIEDLHWADESSLDFLDLLARRTSYLPLVVIGTYRREDSQPHLKDWLMRMTRERLAHELTLKRLNFAEVQTMVQAIVGHTDVFTAPALEQLYGLTEGNPFFVEEVLKVLIENGASLHHAENGAYRLPPGIQIPKSIQDTIYRRTSRLSRETYRVLTLAAVAGFRFDFALLQEVTGENELVLMERIKELMAAQLVVEESEDRFAFRHALTQQAVYAGLLARERRLLHSTVGSALEKLYTTARGSKAAPLAYHFYAAAEWHKARDYAQQAGKEAQALYEPRAAVEQWTRALAAAEHLPPSPTTLALRRGRGWAYEMTGQLELARADYDAALHLAQTYSDESAEWQVLLELGSSWAAHDYMQAGCYFQQALDLAVRRNDGQMLAHSLNRVGNWHLNLDQPHAARQYHQQALSIFQGLQDRPGQVATFDFLGMAGYNCGDMADSVHNFEQALTLGQTLDDRVTMASIWANLGCCAGSYLTMTLISEDGPSCREARTGAPSQRLAQEIGWRAGEAYARITLGQTLGYRGDYDSALAHTREGLAIAQAIAHHEWMAAAHCILGWLYLDLLAPTFALPHAETALNFAHDVGSTIWQRLTSSLLATVYLEQGDLRAAAATLAPVLGPEQSENTLTDRLCRFTAARLELAMGEPRRALEVVDKLIATAPNLECAMTEGLPWLLFVRAEALAALGQETEAELSLQVAKTGAEKQSILPLLWRIKARLSLLYHKQAQHEQAEAAAEEARSLITQLAGTIRTPAMRELLTSRAGQHLLLKGRHPRRWPRPVADRLTPREAEVARLIAQGHSNREIAAQLFITERTVTTHITHIFDKLAFRSRTQIALWVSKQEWSAPDTSQR